MQRFAGNSSVLNFLGNKENYQDVTNQGFANKAMEDIAQTMADARVDVAEQRGRGTIAQAKAGGQITRSQGDVAFSNALAGGIGSFGQSIGGSLLNRGRGFSVSPTQAYESGFYMGSF